MNDTLWYGADEVRVFHPIVEECVNSALTQSGLTDKYYLKHHYGQHTSGIPDFSLHDKQTNDYVCIIEVKKTPLDTLGQEAGYQARAYTKELFPIRWKLGYPPNFCVTNIEYTQFYGLRENSSLIGCLLEDSPKISATIDSAELKAKFTSILVDYFIYIDNRTEHKFSMHLETISESFNESFYSVAQILGANFDRISNFVNANENLRRGVLYELFRFAFYYYIKEFYLLNNNDLASYFDDFETSKLSAEELVEHINSNFQKVMGVDFVNLLKDYPSSEPVFPNMLLANEELGKIFNNFIVTLEQNASEGIKKNSSLLNYVSLITSDIYNKEEMHSTGKIMSDEVLSDVLSNFTINSHTSTVLDPCCGDGNLLVSAYKRKQHLMAEKEYSHNELLNDITGVDIDPNLIQLSAFKLIGQDLNGVNSDTQTNLSADDFITSSNSDKYDAVVMNPPYLRNENLSTRDKEKWLQNIESSTGKRSFIRQVSQPNQYYYFIEKAINKLSNEGTGAFILMSKFLNNKDGEPLKKYLIPHLEAVIHYPPSFFKGFAVTTDIFIVRRHQTASDKISFLNVKDTSLLADLDSLKEIIANKDDVLEDRYTLVNVPKSEIDANSNWRLYLIDPEKKIEKFSQITNIKPISSFFSNIVRGKADNAGGSAFMFPDSGNNVLKELVPNIEPRYIGPGLKINKLSRGRRHFQLTEDCLNGSRGLNIPREVLTDLDHIDLPQGITTYLLAMKDKLGLNKFKIVMSNIVSSQMTPNIIIPRGDRTKHTVFYYPEEASAALISTNFFALSGYSGNEVFDNTDSIKFIAAFLLSTFGQLQFELYGNSQEGSRKIEKRNIEKFHVPSPDSLTRLQMDKVLMAYNTLDDMDVDMLGTEGVNLRDELDDAISGIIFQKNNLGFENSHDLKIYFHDFLKELVENRVLV